MKTLWTALAVGILACGGCSSVGNVPSAQVGAPFVSHRLADRFAASGRLLYVSDYNNGIVQVYGYPPRGKETPAATLTGFLEPQGMCVGDYDHAFIVNSGDFDVLEYEYGATKPLVSWPNQGNVGIACAWDASTSTLAISDVVQVSVNGAVSLCSAPGRCNTYQEPAGIVTCLFLDYLPNGDLYLDGFSKSGFAMAYLRHGTTTWQPVTYSGPTPNVPGNVQWDGRYLTVGDQQSNMGYAVIYRCKPSGAKVDCRYGKTLLKPSSDVPQYFIKPGSNGVVGPDAVTGDVDTWAYPGGGQPLPHKHIHVPQSNPRNFGAAILNPPN